MLSTLPHINGVDWLGQLSVKQWHSKSQTTRSSRAKIRNAEVAVSNSSRPSRRPRKLTGSPSGRGVQRLAAGEKVVVWSGRRLFGVM